MDIETELVVDDLEAMVADEDDGLFGDAAPTADCTIIGPNCS